MTFRYKTKLAQSTAEHLAFFHDTVCPEQAATLLERRSAMIEIAAQALIWIVLEENPGESTDWIVDELLERWSERSEELDDAIDEAA
jgi:hypothetical protein